MSESGESVDNEIEICIPKSVAVDEGGEGDAFNQKRDDAEPEMESLSFITTKMNEECQFPQRPTCIPQQFPTPARTPVVNVTVKPEPYDGKDSWEEYISHFEDCAELGRWTDREKVLFLATSLRDQARTFYMSLSVLERRSYDTLIDKFSRRFGNSRHQNKWLSKLEMRKRLPGESAAALGDDIRQMAQKAYCNLDDTAQELLALNHLYKVVSVEMKCRCIDKNCQTVSDAADVIDRYEAILGENTDRKKQVRATKSVDESSDHKQTLGTVAHSQITDPCELLQEISARLERLEKNGKKSSNHLCFNCNSPKHFIKDCPHPRNNKSRDVSRTQETPKRQNYSQGNGRPSAQ